MQGRVPRSARGAVDLSRMRNYTLLAVARAAADRAGREL